MLKAASAKHSVHYVTVGGGRGFRTSFVADVAGGRGIQRITVVRRGRTGHVTVLVVRSTAYIRGDAFALHAYMGFPKAEASLFAGRWLSVPHSSPVYASVASDATFGSFLRFLFPRRDLSVVHSRVRGMTVVGIHGTARLQGINVTETVFARASGTALPIQSTQVIHAPRGGTGHTTISRWNEAVRLHAPAHATKI